MFIVLLLGFFKFRIVLIKLKEENDWYSVGCSVFKFVNNGLLLEDIAMLS